MSNETGVEIAKKTLISEGVKYLLPIAGGVFIALLALIRRRLDFGDIPLVLSVAGLFAIWILYARERRTKSTAPSALLAPVPVAEGNPEKTISVRLSNVRIVIEAVDSGVIYFTLLALNSGSMPAETERLDVHGVMVGTFMLKTHDHSISKSYTLQPHAPTELTYSFGLDSVNVRLALIGITPAPNLRATPTATTRLTGTLVLSNDDRRFTVVVEQQIPPTQISVINSVVDTLTKAGHLTA